MKLSVRILLAALCAAVLLTMPFYVSSPHMLDEVRGAYAGIGEEEEDEGEDSGLLRLFVSEARAEDDLIVEVVDEGKFDRNSPLELPLDFSVPPAPNPDNYTENGYEDETIRVRLETQEENGVIWHVAYVDIADASQLRTAIAGKKVTSKKDAKPSTMAKVNHAVVAINSDYYTKDPDKTAFEVRMTQKIRTNNNRFKDTLIIDREGNFHLDRFIKGEYEASAYYKEHQDDLVNVFTFGPALVKDGKLQEIDENYGYNPNGREPRSAIGQTGELSYVMVIAEGRGESSGVNFAELAQKMYDLGCQQAFNLDGGNSSILIFNGESYQGQPGGTERSQSDIIYFATAVPEQ